MRKILKLIARIHRALTPQNRLWFAVFACWILLLTGLLEGLTGSTGVLQLVRLQSLLESKNRQSDELKEVLRKTEEHSVQLEKNRAAQLREVRRVLGYIGPDELVFDFSTDPTSPSPSN